MSKHEDNERFVRAFQRHHGLTIDGWAGVETFAALGDAPVKEPAPPKAARHAIPDDYWPMLSRIESGGLPFVKAKSSSASGLYQFIKSTWISEGGSWGPNMLLAFGGLNPPIEEQLHRVKSFTAKNAAALAKAGIPINKASLYAAHFFGPTTAIKVIGADVNASAEALAGPAATKANPSILKGKTVGQFLTWLHKKTGDWAR